MCSLYTHTQLYARLGMRVGEGRKTALYVVPQKPTISLKNYELNVLLL